MKKCIVYVSVASRVIYRRLALLAFLGSVMRSVFPSATRWFAPVIARNFCPPSCSRIVFATFIFVTPICFFVWFS